MALTPIIKFPKKFGAAGGHAKVASPALEQKGSVALINVGERRPWSSMKRAAAIQNTAAPQYASALERSLDPVSMHPPTIEHHLSLLARSLPKQSESVRALQRVFHQGLLPAVQRYFETGASDFSRPFATMTRALRTLETELVDQVRMLQTTEIDTGVFEAASGHINTLHQALGKLAGRRDEVAAAALGKRLSDAVLTRQLVAGANYVAAIGEHFLFDPSELQIAVTALSTASVRSMPARYNDLLTALSDLEYGLIIKTRAEHLSNHEKDALYDLASAFTSIQERALRLFRDAGLKAPSSASGARLRAALKAAAT